MTAENKKIAAARKKEALKEVKKLGLAVFGSEQKYKIWLKTPSPALGGYMPIELASMPNGKEKLLRELVKIDRGIPA